MSVDHEHKTLVREIRRVTAWGLLANLGLAALKLVTGLLSASQGLVADAVHSLSDSSTDMAVLLGAPYWSAPADEQHPHGHGRIETIITLAIGIVLAAVGAGLAYHALASIEKGHVETPGWVAFAAACVSIVVKEWLYRWNIQVGRRLKSSALMANAWHHRSDALSSIPVAVAVLASCIWPAWSFLDRVAAVIVSALILYVAWQVVWPALRQLSDAGAAREQQEAILAVVRETEGVRSVHALRTRHIGPGLQIDLHVLVDPDLTVHQGHNIAGAVKRRLLRDVPEVVDVLVHVEPYGESEPPPNTLS